MIPERRLLEIAVNEGLLEQRAHGQVFASIRRTTSSVTGIAIPGLARSSIAAAQYLLLRGHGNVSAVFGFDNLVLVGIKPLREFPAVFDREATSTGIRAVRCSVP